MNVYHCTVCSVMISCTNIYYISEFKFDGFALETCRSMVAMMDVSFRL